MKIKALYIFAFLIFLSGNIRSEIINIKNSTDDFPVIRSEFFVFDKNGNPVTELRPVDLLVTDNGTTLPINEVTCLPGDPDKNYSINIAFDLSLDDRVAMDWYFEYGQYSAKQIARKAESGVAQVSITSFDKLSYLNSDITYDQSLLENAIDDLNPSRTSNLNEAFLAEPAGAFEIMSSSSFEKNLIIITNSKGEIDAQTVIDKAIQDGIRIHCLTIGYQINTGLKEIVEATGGYYFENLKDSVSAANAANAIIAYIKDYEPCELNWTSELNCDEEKDASITIIDDDTFYKFSVEIPEKSKPRLTSNPPYLGFGGILPGNSDELTVKIYAENRDINISSLSVDPPFTILSPVITSPDEIVLKVGESIDVIVRFEPQDSSIVFSLLSIESDACSGNEIYITGGFPNTPPTERTLEITNPNCDDNVFIIGDTAQISWTGLLPTDVIQLLYSVDNGMVWDTLVTDIDGLKYVWNVPDRPSDECKIRAVQLWPNNVAATRNFWHNSIVYSAIFNNDGAKILTASEDKSARIWNSNTGVLEKKFDGHTDFVLWADYSPDEKFIATASKDSTAKIWDVETGEILHELIGHKGEVRSIRFNPDGSKVVTASADRQSIIWDVETGEAIDTVCCNNIPLRYAEFSHNGDWVVYTTTGYARIYSLMDKQTIKEFKVDQFATSVVNHAEFSSDDSKIVTADWFGNAIVWDVDSGDSLMTMVHMDSDSVRMALSTASFDDTGDRVLTASGTDNIVNLWDANTGELEFPLIEHIQGVKTAFFNFDGSRIITAGIDSIAKVWNLDQRDLQTDISDCLFRIVQPEVLGEDIVFDTTQLGSRVDSTIDGFLTNELDFSFDIKEINLIGANVDDFKIISGYAPYEINADTSVSIDIRFKPQDIGLREASMQIIIPNDTIYTKIQGFGFRSDIVPNYSYIDFEMVELGEYKDSVVSMIITNISDDDVEFTDIYVSGSNEKEFQILTGDDLKLLPSGASHEMEIRFIPENIGRASANLNFEFDAPGSFTNIYLFGEGVYPIIDTATIAIGSAKAFPGDIVEVDVAIKNVGIYGINESFSGFEFDLRFNPTLLLPLDDQFEIVSEFDRKLMKVQVPSSFGSDSILTTLQFKAALGNDSTTILELANASPIGIGKIVLFEESGRFDLLGICNEREPRLFDYNGEIMLSQNFPNPAENKTEIVIEVFEKGNTKIIITDLLGQHVKTILNKRLEPGEYPLVIDVSEIPPGTYIYIMQTPTVKISRQMQLVR